MEKKIWVKIDKWDKKLITTAIEGGADAVIVPKGKATEVKELGIITTISEDGDLILGKDVLFYTIKTNKDEDEIFNLSQKAKLIIKSEDWTIIPFENLIARGVNFISYVKDYKEALTALGILEKGVEGVLFEAQNPIELKTFLTKVKSLSKEIKLDVAKISKVKSLGMGDRVCIDTCSIMSKGEGMLVGNHSNALFLVHAESIENPYVSKREFRVNAGAIHLYIKNEYEKTKYLSELKAGDKVIISNFEGKTNYVTIGRIKIEKRPLMLIEAEVNETTISVILQNAETIRLTSPKGDAISVVNLKKDDEVLVVLETGARHFGYKIDENIIEK